MSAPIIINTITEAIEHEDIEWIRKYLRKGQEITKANDDGLSALHVAAQMGKINMMDLLLSCGHDPNHKALGNKQTPLMLAALHGHQEAIDLLIRHKANPNIQDASGYTLLMYAIHTEQSEIICKLLNMPPQFIDIEIKDSGGRTALLYTLSLLEIIDLGKLRALKDDLQKAKESQNSELITHCESLLRAEQKKLNSQQRFVSIAKMLIARGAFLDAQDNELKSASMYAVEKNHIALLQQFAEKGNNLALTDRRGRTVFHLAQELVPFNKDLVGIMNKLEERVDQATRNTLKILPLELNPKAAMAVNTTLIQKASTTPTAAASETTSNANDGGNGDGDGGAVSGVRNFFDSTHFDSLSEDSSSSSDFNPNATNTNGQSLLMLAAYKGNEELVQKLLPLKADVNATDNRGFTAIMYAAVKGHLNILRHLLKYRARVEAKNKEGLTALALATIADQAEVMKLLFSKGAKINVVYDDKNLLVIAAIHGCVNAMKALIKMGMNPFLKDFTGRSAFEHAIEHKQTKILGFLKTIKK
ncbi:MAG: ankyrin repeat domain-containing protein [Oligoflexia bacterium]|nr:ankyrin repeat domain-containing protein [Oligoflexia bacterium]